MTRDGAGAGGFAKPDADRVAEAIAQAERRTSAEIKVVVLARAGDDLDARAARAFRDLGLDRTERRNAVLILAAIEDRVFLLHGDEGIHARVGQGFWDGARDAMQAAFREGRIADGLIEGIRLAGAALANHFPRRPDDRNEIPDEVIRP